MNLNPTRALRLYIEYALIAMVIVIGVWGAWYYVEGLKLKSDLENVSVWALKLDAANKDNQKALKMTADVAAANSLILTTLAESQERLTKRDRETDAKIAALEKSNEAVRAYLDARIPSGCVLDNTCNTNGSKGSDAARRAAEKVPATQPGSDH